MRVASSRCTEYRRYFAAHIVNVTDHRSGTHETSRPAFGDHAYPYLTTTVRDVWLPQQYETQQKTIISVRMGPSMAPPTANPTIPWAMFSSGFELVIDDAALPIPATTPKMLKSTGNSTMISTQRMHCTHADVSRRVSYTVVCGLLVTGMVTGLRCGTGLRDWRGFFALGWFDWTPSLFFTVVCSSTLRMPISPSASFSMSSSSILPVIPCWFRTGQ
eukprot:1698699-Prymnesium_polylepis.1